MVEVQGEIVIDRRPEGVFDCTFQEQYFRDIELDHPSSSPTIWPLAFSPK